MQNGYGFAQETEANEKISNSETGFLYLKRNFYGLCLEALREIGTMFVSVDLIQKTGIAKILSSLRYYPTPDIAQYAAHICQKWMTEIEKHKQTMTSLDTLVDPLDAVGHLLK